MTTYTWTDNMMRSGSTCDVDKVADNLMHLKYNAGGLLPVINLGTITSNFTLDPNKIDMADITASLTISLPTTGFISGVENKCIFDFTTTSSSSPTLPTGLKWNGSAPTAFQAATSVRNVLTFTTKDGGTTWEADYKTYGGVEVTFTRPNLTANGTMGGSSFAVRTNKTETCPLWQAFDGSGSTYCYLVGGTVTQGNIDIYNPSPLKVSSFSITSYDSQEMITGGIIYASNDDSTYTSLGSFTTSVSGANGTIAIPSGSQGFYKYYRIAYSSMSASYGPELYNIGMTATYISI